MPRDSHAPSLVHGDFIQDHRATIDGHRSSHLPEGLFMSQTLQGKRIAIVATDGFEQVELLEPKRALEAAGAKVDVISPKSGQIKGWNHTDWGETVKVDKTLEEAKVSDYDGMVLPGGQINPD